MSLFINSQLAPLGMPQNNNIGSWALQSMLQNALKYDQAPPHNCNLNGILKVPFGEYAALLNNELGGKPFNLYYYSNPNKPYGGGFQWDDTIVSVDYSSYNQELRVFLVSTNLERFKEIFNKTKALIDNTPKGRVSAILSGCNGPHLQNIGLAAVDYVPDNYTPDVNKEFAHVISDLNKPNPCGRLSIFDGSPGTGKSFGLRALMGTCPMVHFVLLNSSMVTDIVGPSLLNLLVTAHNDAPNIPIALIIEDADSCLTSRGADNISSISTLLNLGDGIMGSMLNIRIICTTNAGHLKDHNKIDPAIMRSGRLCRRIHIGKLPVEQANARYSVLSNDPSSPFTDSTTIADIYRLANNPGTPIEDVVVPQRGGMGFSVEYNPETKMVFNQG